MAGSVVAVVTEVAGSVVVVVVVVVGALVTGAVVAGVVVEAAVVVVLSEEVVAGRVVLVVVVVDSVVAVVCCSVVSAPDVSGVAGSLVARESDGCVSGGWVVAGGAGAAALSIVSAIASPTPAAATAATASTTSRPRRRSCSWGAITTVAAVESLVVTATSPSSATRAAPFRGRSVGLLAREAAAMLSSCGGASGRSSDTDGAGRSRCMAARASPSGDSNGSLPVSILNRITPNA